MTQSWAAPFRSWRDLTPEFALRGVPASVVPLYRQRALTVLSYVAALIMVPPDHAEIERHIIAPFAFVWFSVAAHGTLGGRGEVGLAGLRLGRGRGGSRGALQVGAYAEGVDSIGFGAPRHARRASAHAFGRLSRARRAAARVAYGSVCAVGTAQSEVARIDAEGWRRSGRRARERLVERSI